MVGTLRVLTLVSEFWQIPISEPVSPQLPAKHAVGQQ